MTQPVDAPRHVLDKAQSLIALAKTLATERQEKNDALRISKRTDELDSAVGILESAVISAKSISELCPTFDWGASDASARHRKFAGLLKRDRVLSDAVFASACNDLRKFAKETEVQSRRVWASWKRANVSDLPMARLNTLDPDDQLRATQIRDRILDPKIYDDPTPAAVSLFQRDLRELTEVLEAAPELPTELEDVYQVLSTTGIALSHIDDTHIALLRSTGTLGDRIILKVVH